MSNTTSTDTTTDLSNLVIDPPRYRKTATIRADRIDFPFTVQSKEGTLQGNAGDWLALADDDTPTAPHRWIISADAFAATYVPVEV